MDIEKEGLAAYNERGVACAERGDFAEAKGWFEKALELTPTSVDALVNMGNIYREEGNFAQAKNYYLKAIEVDPDYHLPHNNLAVVYKQLKDYSAFVREIKLAQKLERKSRLAKGKPLKENLFSRFLNFFDRRKR